MSASVWLGWLAIGAAASLAAMIWPSRRGALGVLGNILVGMAGSALGALAGVEIIGAEPSSGECLAVAAFGAIVALALGHVAWSIYAGWRVTHRSLRSDRMAGLRPSTR